MAEFSAITYGAAQGRATISLNRPDKLNAMTMLMQKELCEALWHADHDSDVHVVVLQGNGRGFCAGYDLTGSARHEAPVSRQEPKQARGVRSFDDDAWHLERAQRYRMALFDMHKPVICKVHGYCMAGGIDLALLSDMTICADDAQFGFPPARNLGTLPNNMWIYNIGPQWAKRLLLTGDTITGKEAHALGLVMMSVPLNELDGEVSRLADRLALIDPDLLAVNKRVVNLALELMGARTLQRLALELDVRGHQSSAARSFMDNPRAKPVRELLQERDANFGDGRVHVRPSRLD